MQLSGCPVLSKSTACPYLKKGGGCTVKAKAVAAGCPFFKKETGCPAFFKADGCPLKTMVSHLLNCVFIPQVSCFNMTLCVEN
jgi:hypothetical protein